MKTNDNDTYTRKIYFLLPCWIQGNRLRPMSLIVSRIQQNTQRKVESCISTIDKSYEGVLILTFERPLTTLTMEMQHQPAVKHPTVVKHQTAVKHPFGDVKCSFGW